MTAATTALPRTPVRTTGAPGATAAASRRTSRRTWLVGATVLVALAAADALFVTESLAVQRTGAEQSQWLLTTDRGHAELFGYAKQAVTAVLLLTVAFLARRAVFAAYAAVFLTALADDALQVHERAGGLVAERLALPDGVAGLRAQDLGELAVWGLLAVVPLLAIAVLHVDSDRRTRRVSLRVAAVVLVYGLFGVVADQVHSAAGGGRLEQALATIEDGGELLALSLAVAVVAAMIPAARRLRDPAA